MASKAGNIIRQHGLLLAALLAAIVAYARIVGYGHISWDDPEMVFRNAQVKAFDLPAFFSNHYVGNYLPLTMIFHASAWTLFGDNDAGHHLLNIIIHLVNGVLVYFLSLRLFRQQPYAVLAGIVMLLHPLQVESVAWISELKNVLYASCFLSGLHAYVLFYEGKKAKHYALSLLLFVLSCLSKPSAVAFPLVLLVCDLILRRRIERRDLVQKIPFFLIALAFGIINLYTQREDRFLNYAHAYPVFERVAMACIALIKYAQLFVAPVNLSVIYPYPEPDGPLVMGGFVLLIAAVSLTVWLTRKKKILPLALLLFIVVNLLLVLQLIPFGEALYADRYMYVAIAGFAWLLAFGLQKLRIDHRLVATMLLLLLSALTFARTGKWRSAIVLYEDIIKKYPDNFVALNSAGVEAMFIGQDRKALSYLQRAIKAGPRNYKGHYNLGLLLLKMQMWDRAIEKFSASIALYDYSKAYTGRATAYYLKGDFPKAVHDAERALALDPKSPKAWFVLASCYSDMNQLGKALDAINYAIALDPNDGEFYFKRAIIKGKQQRFKDCIADLQLALHLRADLYEAYYWMGVARANLGQSPCRDLKIAAQHNYEPAIAAYKRMCR